MSALVGLAARDGAVVEPRACAARQPSCVDRRDQREAITARCGIEFGGHGLPLGARSPRVARRRRPVWRTRFRSRRAAAAVRTTSVDIAGRVRGDFRAAAFVSAVARAVGRGTGGGTATDQYRKHSRDEASAVRSARHTRTFRHDRIGAALVAAMLARGFQSSVCRRPRAPRPEVPGRVVEPRHRADAPVVAGDRGREPRRPSRHRDGRPVGLGARARRPQRSRLGWLAAACAGDPGPNRRG